MSHNKIIVMEGEIAGFRVLKDRSVSLSIHTPELSAENNQRLIEIQGHYVNILLKDGDLNETDANKLIAHKLEDDRPRKTLSQRLRDVLYVSWEQDPQGFRMFLDYYSFRMTSLIEMLKNKLE